jgi:hypothetical protein
MFGLGAFVVAALVSSLSPPRGPQDLGEATVTLTADPDPPRMGSNRVLVRLARPDGGSLSDVALELAYGLESGGILTRAEIQPVGPGVYRSDLQFDRPGPWQVVVTLRREGASDLHARYLYNVAASVGDQPALAGIVRIAPRLAGKVAPGDVLFVIARRGPGPPLAVARIPSPTFPASFRLGRGDMVMAQGEFQGKVWVMARITKGGAAGPARPGDLEGSYSKNPATVGQGPIEIVIDREL